eukprot:TRINITY_DN74149_c0_g1_i1.p1 TRINITY_DN74149_c0_g1~~TRINITY_DN74149_c0_g1_i1.p1  ORF type:complete len:617 (+),score=108.82 TRINITY_DN74149_c0_g1_i1:120-1970(+)
MEGNSDMRPAQGTQVTVTVPDGAPPGTLLSIPVKANTDKVKVRVPEGCGMGSTLILVQQEGTEEWSLKVGKLVPYEEDVGPEEDAKVEEQQPAQAEEELDEVTPTETSKVERSQQEQLREEAAVAEQSLETPRKPASQDEDATQAIVMPEKQQGYRPVEPLPLPSPERAWDGAVAYTVRLHTTVGTIDIIVRPDWAPNGTRRFLDLAASGDLEDLAFYRCIKGCIVQFGLPAKRHWPPIPDDPPTGVPFLLGAVSFAAVGENTRRSTLFICIGDMSHCLGEKSWETPIGAVAESSLEVLERIETCYGDIAEFGGRGPDTGCINEEGNAYLRSQFPRLSYIRSATALDWDAGSEKTQKRQQRFAAVEDPGRHELNDSLAKVTPRGRSNSVVAPTSRTAAARAASREAQALALEAARNAQLAAEAEDPEEALRAALCARQAADAAQAAAEAAEAAQAALGGQRSSSFVPSPVRRPSSAVRVPVSVQSRPRSSSAVRAASTSSDLRWTQRNAGYQHQEPHAWPRIGGGSQCRAGSAALPPGVGYGLQDTVPCGGLASAWPLRHPIAAQPLRIPAAWASQPPQSSARPVVPLQPNIAQGLLPGGQALSPWPQPALTGPRW